MRTHAVKRRFSSFREKKIKERRRSSHEKEAARKTQNTLILLSIIAGKTSGFYWNIRYNTWWGCNHSSSLRSWMRRLKGL
jgi:hypothetical protein